MQIEAEEEAYEEDLVKNALQVRRDDARFHALF
jgi:hypothetical protein